MIKLMSIHDAGFTEFYVKAMSRVRAMAVTGGKIADRYRALLSDQVEYNLKEIESPSVRAKMPFEAALLIRVKQKIGG